MNPLSDTEISDYEDDDSEDDFNNDLQTAYNALIVEYGKVKKQRSAQHTRNCKLRSERDSLKAENEELLGKLSILDSEKTSQSQNAEKFKVKLEEKNKRIEELEKFVGELQEDINKLKEKIESDENIISKMNFGSHKFEEIWSKQRPHGDKSGLGYTGEKGTIASSSSAPLVAPKVCSKPAEILKYFPKPVAPPKKSFDKLKCHQNSPPMVKGMYVAKSQSFVPTCHHCGIKGHIRPNCHKLYGLPLNYVKKFSKSQNPSVSITNRFQTFSDFFKNNFKNSLQFQKPKNLNFSKLKYKEVSKKKNLNFNEKQGSEKSIVKIIFPKTRAIWVRKSDLITKPLGAIHFESLKKSLGICAHP